MKTTVLICIFTVTAALCLASDDLHKPWDDLLQRHVRDGRVDYKAIKADPEQLETYLKTLGAANPSGFSRADQLAYWINSYNAFTVKLILDNYPLKSIRDIRKPWARTVWVAGGVTYSLNEIEHSILREQLKEPRIHFAIVCASIGCPDLYHRAFLGSQIEEQLAHTAKLFMQSPKHVRTSTGKKAFGRAKKTLHLSRIFNWFAGDFTSGGTRTVAQFVAQYATETTQSFISSAGEKLSVEFLDYDWDLNGL